VHLLIGRAQLSNLLPHLIIVYEPFFPEKDQKTRHQKNDQDKSSPKLHRLVPERLSSVMEET
jgi:hypothetical protein